MPLHGRNDWFHTHCACTVHRHNHSSATHPPLGVNATKQFLDIVDAEVYGFQWAPTLGGECYAVVGSRCMTTLSRFNGHPPLGVNATHTRVTYTLILIMFQWAPTLGGECYVPPVPAGGSSDGACFNGHPPLGVNATQVVFAHPGGFLLVFQWAPTLGGECYAERDPLLLCGASLSVSMGTHPWG